VIPICDPVMTRVPIEQLPTARVSVYSTLYVPPLSPHQPLQPEVLHRLAQGVFS
jgi:hypothetical protein